MVDFRGDAREGAFFDASVTLGDKDDGVLTLEEGEDCAAEDSVEGVFVPVSCGGGSCVSCRETRSFSSSLLSNGLWEAEAGGMVAMEILVQQLSTKALNVSAPSALPPQDMR